jgi:hypothetical protein
VARYATVLAGEVIKQIAVLVPSRELPPLEDVQHAFGEGEEAVRSAEEGPERERLERALLGLEERLERVRRGNGSVPAAFDHLLVTATSLVEEVWAR